MLRPPVPNAKTDMLETRTRAELTEIFESCMKTGPKGTGYSLLPEAWGRLFSDAYLSSVELAEEMGSGVHRLGIAEEEMLRRFIRADWPGGGTFVLSVIEKGGMVDRTALIMIADPGDLAAIEHDGTTALHLLIRACDRRVRPVLIRRAGRRLLSGVYDRNGMPVLMTIFGLGDLGPEDLDAIREVFPGDDLGKVMAKNRMGRNALEIFTEIAGSMKGGHARDRNTFVDNQAVRTTNSEGVVRQQINSPAQGWGAPAPQARAVRGDKGEPDRTRGGSEPCKPAKQDPAAAPVNKTRKDVKRDQHSSANATGPEEPVVQAPPFRAGATTVRNGGPERGAPVSPPSGDGPAVPVTPVPADAVTGKTAGPDQATAADAAGKEKGKSALSGDLPSCKKILVVDDDPVILRLMVLRLKNLGYEMCAVAESGDDAVQLARYIQFDIVFMDINLPGSMDGIDAAREIKKRSNPRVVFLTGFSGPELIERARGVQDGYILKPFTDNDLRITLSLMR